MIVIYKIRKIKMKNILTSQVYPKIFQIQSILIQQINYLNLCLSKLNKNIKRDVICQVLKNQQNKIYLLSIENERLKKIIEVYQN